MDQSHLPPHVPPNWKSGGQALREIQSRAATHRITMATVQMHMNEKSLRQFGAGECDNTGPRPSLSTGSWNVLLYTMSILLNCTALVFLSKNGKDITLEANGDGVSAIRALSLPLTCRCNTGNEPPRSVFRSCCAL